MEPNYLEPIIQDFAELNIDQLKAIIRPVINEVCHQTVDEITFASHLNALNVMTDNQFEQFKLEGTPFQKNIYLYNNVIKKAAGKELIEALQKSENDHIIKMLVESYDKRMPRRDAPNLEF